MLFVGLKRKFRGPSAPNSSTLRKGWFPAVTFSLFAATALGAWFTPYFFPVQPDPVNMQPIVHFLRAADRAQYRYLTFGFGDQFAYLNLQTEAITIDGSYHTARSLPELRESGIGQIDTVYWALKGVPAIEPILEKSGEYGVRWGFVNPETLTAIRVRWGFIHRSPFVPTLEKLGWVRMRTLSNGILVYENPQAIVPEPVPAPKDDPLTSFSWGAFPLLSLITTLSLGALRVAPKVAERVIQASYSVVVALIPISLCFWFYRTIAESPHSRVYFTYTDALFFFSDALAIVGIILWLAVKISRQQVMSDGSSLLFSSFTFRPLSEAFTPVLFAVFVLISLSVFWSRDWTTSLYISIHFWLIFLLILSLRDWSHAWNSMMLGLCVALSVQIITGLIGFAHQSTAFLQPLGLEWPGMLDPFTRGAVVVHASDGLRVLRAYGTFPHPNILGGFTLVALLGPISLFFAGKKLYHPALILYGLGVSLLALTFSRSAWLGIIIFLLILILKSRYLDRRKLSLLLMITVLSCAITLLPRLQLVLARSVNLTSNSEKFSFVGRAWLNQQATQIFLEHPLFGTGIGSFIIELSQRAGYGYIIEPAHNIFLSMGAELGLVGLALIVVLFISMVQKIIKAQTPKAILGSASVAGLGIISLFDHYLWTLAPGRVLLGLMLGLWVGQVARNEYEI